MFPGHQPVVGGRGEGGKEMKKQYPNDTVWSSPMVVAWQYPEVPSLCIVPSILLLCFLRKSFNFFTPRQDVYLNSLNVFN